MTGAHSIAQQYQQPLWGAMDRALRNCFVGAGILGLLVLIAVFVVPKTAPKPTTLTDVPERIARLIVEGPKKTAAPPMKPRGPAQVAETPKVETPPTPVPKPQTQPRARTSPPRVAENKGVQGRQKAQQEVSQNLAQVTGSLDKVLSNLEKSLPASEKSVGDQALPRGRRSRGVRSGRSSQQLSSVQGVSTLSSADVSTSAIAGEGIRIDAITDLSVVSGSGDPSSLGGSSGGGGGGSTQGGRGELRSNEALLSVVRRYAPGIQFCYDNELKKNPGLRGKLVVSLTVLASGQVSEAFVVENTLRSNAVVECVLAQIRGWQFPAIPHGNTSFKTPFVFTPPE